MSDGRTAPDGVLPLASLESKRAEWRADGRTVVFTNGVFDLLHRGHVTYLEAAARLGDVLVVGVNDDASVRRLGKGDDRPIVPEADRAFVVAGLRAVAGVVLFGEDTPLRLIEALQPDVLVKGMDWKDKGVVGREVVEESGGKVVLVDLLEGRSTTSVVDRIRDA